VVEIYGDFQIRQNGSEYQENLIAADAFQEVKYVCI